MKNEIMIGHAARPTGNHIEIFESLSKLSIPNKLFIPLEYGDQDYKIKIKKAAINYFEERVLFLETKLDMTSYFQRLSVIGFAIFNFVMQEGLGNIIFLLWNGAKVFLRKESSVYLQFKIWDLKIFTIDELNENNLREHLEQKYVDHNKIILENLLSRNKVKEYWKALFQ